MKAAVFYATREGQTRKIAERIASDLRAHDMEVELRDVRASASGLSTLNKDQIAERGARIARRDDRGYREYVREEQRREPGCPAREVVLDQRGQATSPIDWDHYVIGCIAASVHVGHHEREMIDFVRRHRHDLHRLATAFVSVTLTEAGAEDERAPADRRKRAAADAQRMIDIFIRQTGWHPDRSLRVAGALAYSRYNWLIRFVMKRIARKAGAPTGASRDYEFTNWPALDGFVDEMHRATLARVG